MREVVATLEGDPEFRSDKDFAIYLSAKGAKTPEIQNQLRKEYGTTRDLTTIRRWVKTRRG